MFILGKTKTYNWSNTTGTIYINTDHIISVEEFKDGTALVTCTGKNKEDEVLYYHLENSFNDIITALVRGRKL